MNHIFIVCSVLPVCAVHANYTVGVKSNGMSSVTISPGSSINLNVEAISNTGNFNDIAVLDIVFSTTGMTYESYEWMGGYTTNNPDDLSTPDFDSLPVTLNSNIHFENFHSAAGSFTSGTLVSFVLYFPTWFPAGNIQLDISNMCLLEGFSCANATTESFTITVEGTPECREEQTLSASDASANSSLGSSVSLSGDTTVVGARWVNCTAGGNSCGAAYVYQFNGITWVEKQKLTASDVGPNDFFGWSVSISGDTVVVGSVKDDCSAGIDCGSAYVFQYNGSSWVEIQKLTASDAEESDQFGISVSVSGDTVVVGANEDDCVAGINCGSAYIYRFDGTNWIEEQKLTASDLAVGAGFGISVSLSGNTALIGAQSTGCVAGPACGSAYVFQFNGTSWVEVQKLTASDAAQGDWFGYSVTLSGDTAVVGARYRDCTAGTDCGSAYVYRFGGTSWVEEQQLFASDAAVNDWFGTSISVSGDTIVVGASFDDCAAGDDCGSAYIYRFDGTSWCEDQKFIASDAAMNDWFGTSVSVSADTTVVGAPRVDCGAGEYCGSIYVYRCPSITAPIVTSEDDLFLGEGFMINRVIASFIDDVGDSHTASIDWGDGIVTVGTVDQGADTVTGWGHAYGDNGIYTVTVRVDDGSEFGLDSFDVTVTNSDPVISAGPDRMVTIGEIVDLQSETFDLIRNGESGPFTWPIRAFANSARFADLGFDVPETPSVEDFTAVVNWDDGIGDQPAMVWESSGSSIVPTEGSITASTIFTTPGDYNVCVTIFDDDGGSSTDCSVVTAVNTIPTRCSTEQQLIAIDARAGDQFGSSVSISSNTALVGALGVDCLVGSDCGAAYVYRINNNSWTLEQELSASDAGAGDNFGIEVAITGDTAVVGARNEDCIAGDDCGAVYVFRFDGTSWIEEQKLTASDATSFDNFGESLSVSGDTIVVTTRWKSCPGGGCGSVYVFRFNGTIWVEEQKLTVSDFVLSLSFEPSVSVNSDTIVMGAFRAGPGVLGLCDEAICGSAYIFRYDGMSWVEEQRLVASDTGDGFEKEQFGRSVSVSGDTVVVGALEDDCSAGQSCGSAYVFRFDGISWIEQQRLTASDVAAGDQFGTSVSVSGSTIAVGAHRDECAAGRDCGSVYVFRFNGTSWFEDQKLSAFDAAEYNQFGVSVAVSVDMVVVGADSNDCPAGQSCGSAYAYYLQDVTKDRYLSFDPNTNPGQMAAVQVRRVGSAIPWYMSCSLQDASTDGMLSELVTVPEFCEWVDSCIHVRGCIIVPGNEYVVKSTTDDVVLSTPLSTYTTTPQSSASRQFGDVVGALIGEAWTAPDGLVTVNDITAVVQKFQLNPTAPHLSRVDNDGKTPNGILASNDILRAVVAFAGGDFGFGVTDCLTGTCVPSCP